MTEKYNPTEREKHWQKYWEKEQIYKFNESSEKPVFSIDTPPPYVNADHLHAGHIMSYTQAELIARYKRMRGYNVFYPMGFDDNGLPTERFVEKKYNIDKTKISRSDFVKLCLEETKKGAEGYQKLWQALGISVDWSRTYSTMDKNSQKISQTSFIDLYQSGKIYRAEKPIIWCVTCQTAISQADLEDEEKDGELNYIKFGDYLIATTRPELLESCVAVFYNPQDSRYKNLKKMKVPIFDYEVPVLTDESVDPKFGTGLMMVCTWGDQEDIKKWEKYKLATRPFIKPGEKINILENRKTRLEQLQAAGLLEKSEPIKHRVNVHERCLTPIEFILAKQWFVSLLNNKKDFLQRGEELKWHPKFMHRRYQDWVNNLSWDWCISRQRYYGVPFPVYYDQNDQPVLAQKSELPIDPRETKKTGLKPEVDVMDTWMTSSLTPMIIGQHPASLRPQAFEIIRTWLFYTMVKSHYQKNSLPFKEVMISGHGLDEKGRKISKRLGSYQDPQKIIAAFGADALRYWATGARLGHNLRYRQEEVQKGKRTVTKLWNASQFAWPHLAHFATQKNFKPQNKIDAWILYQLNQTIKTATKNLENYEYSKARDAIDNFFWSKFADNYLEFIKYRLYQKNDAEAKNTLSIVLLNILKLYAPILPFITEEIYQKIYKFKRSLHRESWPQAKSEIKNPKIEKFLQEIEEIRKYKSEKKLAMNAPVVWKIKNKAMPEEIKNIMNLC